MTKKTIIILMAIVICFNLFTPNIFAQGEKPLEIDYIDVPAGTTPEEVGTTTVPRYFEYLYYFLIWTSGILALLALIYAGFKYLTSIGNPDKLKDAKNGIFSAFLGLAIVLGSYVILQKINPNFLTWNLPALKPIISTISPGILVCKDESVDNDIMKIWELQEEYLMTNPENLSFVRAKKIGDDINNLLKNVSKNCYYVERSEDVKADFNNNIQRIWMIPERSYIKINNKIEVKDEFHYGAIVFQKEKHSGLSNIFFKHLLSINTLEGPVPFKPTIGISSIIPYKKNNPSWVNYKICRDPELKLLYPGSETWTTISPWSVDLYEKKDYNAGFVDENDKPIPSYFSVKNLYSYYGSTVILTPELREITQNIAPQPIRKGDPDLYYGMEGFPVPPESIRIDGDVLVLLYKDAFKQRTKADEWEMAEPQKDGTDMGWYVEPLFDSDSNLEDNYNIVDWRDCKNYQGTEIKEEVEQRGEGWGSHSVYVNKCAWAAADGIIVIGGIKSF